MNGGELDEKRQVLLGALRELGPGWHSRADLARALGKPRLNVAEITLLDILAESGVLARQSTIPAPGASAFVYRIATGD